MARKKAKRRSRRDASTRRKSAPARPKSSRRKRKVVKTTRRSRSGNRRVSRKTQFASRRKRDAARLKILERKLAKREKRIRKLESSQRALRERSETSFAALEAKLRTEQERVRKQSDVIEDITRPTREVFRGESGEEEEEDGGPFVHVPGEKPVRDSDGEIIGYELPPVMDDVREDLEDFSFDAMDWDELIDDVGDEDEDSYGEGETK